MQSNKIPAKLRKYNKIPRYMASEVALSVKYGLEAPFQRYVRGIKCLRASKNCDFGRFVKV